MAWEWSHSNEAYENANLRLHLKPRRWLEVCLAEIRTDAIEKIAEKIEDDEFDWQKVYAAQLKLLRSRKTKVETDWIVGDIWRFAEELCTCDNGGFNLWVCPSGCHKVSVDDLTEKQFDKVMTSIRWST